MESIAVTQTTVAAAWKEDQISSAGVVTVTSGGSGLSLPGFVCSQIRGWVSTGGRGSISGLPAPAERHS